MNKLFTLSLVMVLSFSAFQLNAQTPRMAFVEEATQASCPPCFSFNPGVINLINANTETTIFLAYQVWWPGFDPMYLDNTADIDARIPYYGITGAPSIVVQGTNYQQTFNQSQINNVTSQTSEFAMTLDAVINDGILEVTGSIDAEMAASGNLRLRIAIAEELITIEDAPGGTNGETEYHHVFKAFIGGPQGIDLADSWEVGDTYEINETFAIGNLNIYHYDGLEVMAWVQNDGNKFVHQAAKVSEIAINTQFDNNVSGVSIGGLPLSVCSGEQTVTPSFKLQNGGNNPLTSVDIFYSVNGGTEQMIAWTGDLSTLANETVTLDPITFMSDIAGNTLSVRLENPNGAEDENSEDNTVETPIELAAVTTNMAEITLTTDNYGNETYWQVTNGAGDIVASGGNPNVGLTNIGVGAGAPTNGAGTYGNNQTIVVEIPIELTDCYTLTVTDFYGDGMC
jgi:hypothetical protein